MLTHDLLLAALPRLRAYIRKLCRGDPDAVEDLVQDAVVKALRYAESFTGDVNGAFSWLCQIAHTTRTDAFRASTRRGTEVPIFDDETGTWLPIEAPPSDPISTIVLKEMFAASSRGSKAIQEGFELLLDIYVDDLSYADIADRRGLLLGTVRSRISRTRSKLQKEFA